ncbi:YgaP family membrane protein [Aeromonas enteropelogenes]|uniref:YgaP family membrane protein n=1 Tax=Aeromonas enteropelogenes TaxID=29489 RepID=UPI003F74AB08
MTVENGVRVVAGCMLLLSLLLTAWVHPGFVWLSVFVGVNLIQSAFTGFCLAAMILKRLGLK